MSDNTVRPRWQSLAETAAVILVACSVAWAAVLKPSVAPTAQKTAAPQRRPEPPLPTEPISLTGASLLGEKTANVAVVIYSDFQCPYCGKFAREVLPIIQSQYVQPGKVLLAFRQFPLSNHQFAQKAAEAAECAARQCKFWPFHDELFADQRALDVVSLKDRARRLALDEHKFATCLDGETAAVVQEDRESGPPLGIVGTPTFLVGTVLPGGLVKVSQRLVGPTLVQFRGTLDRLLSVAKGSASAGANSKRP